MAAKPRQPEDEITAAEAAELDARFGGLSPQQIIAWSASEGFPGAIAAVSSFGADSAVLLNMIAEVDASLPVVFSSLSSTKRMRRGTL